MPTQTRKPTSTDARRLWVLACALLLTLAANAQVLHLCGIDGAREGQPTTVKSSTGCLVCLGSQSAAPVTPAAAAAEPGPVALEDAPIQSSERSRLSVFALYIRPPPLA